MKFKFKNVLMLVMGAMLVSVGAVGAAEIRLRATCQPAGAVITLGDVAEIFTNDADEAQRLAELELTPAAAPGSKRFFRSREIQDLLVARGVNLAEQRFSGAVQVTVETPLPAAPIAEPVAKSNSSLPQPQKIASTAILAYLSEVGGAEPWQVELQLTSAQQQTLRQTVGEIAVAGGTAPWEGEQQFTLAIPTSDGTVQLPIATQVRVSRAAVAVTKPLPKGSIIRAEDLQMVEPSTHVHRVRVEKTFHAIEDVIGKETTRAVSPGQVLDPNYVRSPLLVRRGEVVTVYARAAGIEVRTSGRALADGGAGDLIAIETLESAKREKFDGRVSGPQEVTVSAGAIAGGGKR